MIAIQVFYDGPVVNRAYVKADGLKFYFTGNPCMRGHVDQRRVINGSCLECYVKYIEDNKDAIAEYQSEYHAEYRIANKDKITEYYESNKDKILERNKEYHEANKDRIAAKKREWQEANKGAISEKAKEYQKNNPEKIRARNFNSRARKRNAEGRYTAEDIAEILKRQKNKCAEPTCGVRLKKGTPRRSRHATSKGRK